MLLPKVIENVREQLLEEVRRQIIQRGYAETTVRSVAGACGLGVGTVYNYFKSKDMLIATVVAEDWKRCTERFKNSSPTGAEETVRLIYDMLQAFEEEHKSLFTDPEAAKKYASIFAERHGLLREQIAEFLLPICKKSEEPEFLSQFIAESLLTWVTAGVPFEKMYSVFQKLI